MSWERMPDDLAKALLQEAHSSAPYEMCGFVMSGWYYIPIRNVHPDAERNFAMDELAMLDVLAKDAAAVIGLYHSHPRGTREPSGHDVDLMRTYPHFRSWIVTYNNVFEWRLERDQARPVRLDGTTGSTGLAHALLAPPEAL